MRKSPHRHHRRQGRHIMAGKKPSFFFSRALYSPWRKSMYTAFRTGAMVIVLGLGASLVALDPTVVKYLQASLPGLQASLPDWQAVIPSQLVTPVEQDRQSSLTGVLLVSESVPENESKLTDIFQNVFPGVNFERMSKESDRGKVLVQNLGVKELPTIIFPKSEIEGEPLFASVRDLFDDVGDSVVLRTALVNPSFQVRLGGAPAPAGSTTLGNDTAPTTLMLFSDVTCTDCRVLERSLLLELRRRIGEGSLRVVFIDLPEDEKTIPFSSAMSCVHEKLKSPDITLSLREKLIMRPNLSMDYLDLELQRAAIPGGINACDLNAARGIFDAKFSIAESLGITSLPTVLIGKTGGEQWVRITGAKEFSVYERFLKE